MIVDLKESLESTNRISVSEEMNFEKTMCGEPKKSVENTTMIPAADTMDCSPVKCGDISNKLDAVEKKVLKKTGSKSFFVPWKPPTTPSQLVIDEDKENEGN